MTYESVGPSAFVGDNCLWPGASPGVWLRPSSVVTTSVAAEFMDTPPDRYVTGSGLLRLAVLKAPNGQRVSGERRAEGNERVRCMRKLGGASLLAVFPLFANGVHQARQEKDETKRGREPQQHPKP